MRKLQSNLVLEDTPIFKAIHKGRRALSSAELIATIIGFGAPTDNLDVAQNFLQKNQHSLRQIAKMNPQEVAQESGITISKAAMLVTAFELGRRLQYEEAIETPAIRTSRDIYDIFYPLLCDNNHEEFHVAYLNRANRVISIELLSKGGCTGTVVDVKIMLKRAVQLLANAIILCHNHPSGNIKPSEQDIKITGHVRMACEYFAINLIDHIIITDNAGYTSFADEGLIN